MYQADAENSESDRSFPAVPWGARELVICTVVILVALFVVSTVIIGPFQAAYGRYAPETLVASGIANLLWNVTMIAAVMFFVRRSGAGLRDLGFRLPRGGSPLLRILGLALLTFFSLYIVTFIYTVVIDAFDFSFLEPEPQIPDEFYDSDAALAVLGVGVVVGAPFTEELFFRGFMFAGARRYLGVPLAAMLTGFLFSLAHANLGLIIPFTAIGAVFSLSYFYTRSLYVPIVAHLLFNLVSYSILVFVPEARPS